MDAEIIGARTPEINPPSAIYAQLAFSVSIDAYPTNAVPPAPSLRGAWRDRVREVCTAHGVTWAQVMSRECTIKVSHARQHAYTVVRDCGLSWGRIAMIFDRDHSSCIYGVRMHRARSA